MKKIHLTLLHLTLLLVPTLASHTAKKAFQKALDKENIKRVEELLERHDLEVNLQSNFGSTALMLALAQNAIPVATRLLQHKKINVNLQDHQGNTALMLATVGNHTTCTEQLLKRNDINTNLQNSFGYTPLIFAIHGNNITLTELLLNHDDIDVNLQDQEGDTALIIAIAGNYITIAQQLLKRDDIDINLQNNYGYTPLMIMIHENHVTLAKSLLNHHGIDINLQDHHKKTALAYIERSHINFNTPQSHNPYYLSLVKRTHIPSLHKQHPLLQPTYLQTLYKQQPGTQAMKQYIDILLVNKLSHQLQEKEKSLLYHGCVIAYETKNDHYSIQAKGIQHPKKPSHYQPLLDTDPLHLLAGYLRSIKMQGVSHRSDWVHFIKCYLWANNQFLLPHNTPTITLQQIHTWRNHNSTYPEFLDAANRTQKRALFKVVNQTGEYEAVGTEHLAQGLKQVGMIQEKKQIFEKSITWFTSIILAGIKTSNHQLIPS